MIPKIEWRGIFTGCHYNATAYIRDVCVGSMTLGHGDFTVTTRDDAGLVSEHYDIGDWCDDYPDPAEYISRAERTILAWLIGREFMVRGHDMRGRFTRVYLTAEE